MRFLLWKNRKKKHKGEHNRWLSNYVIAAMFGDENNIFLNFLILFVRPPTSVHCNIAMLAYRERLSANHLYETVIWKAASVSFSKFQTFAMKGECFPRSFSQNPSGTSIIICLLPFSCEFLPYQVQQLSTSRKGSYSSFQQL